MGATTGISWTSMTYNPWTGCQRTSPGCAACYMYADKKRYGQNPRLVARTKDATFLAPFKWHKEVEQGKRTGHDRLVFTCSWSDFFLEEADVWRPDVWEIIRQTPGLIYQVLTKRPDRIRDHLPSDWGQGWPHVWLGISAENQVWFVRRWNILKRIPARLRFVSYEPALGPLDLYAGLLATDCGYYCDEAVGHVDHGPWPAWVLAGGESGPNARPCDPAWIASLYAQCQEAGVAFFCKQDSGLRSGKQGRIPDHIWHTKQFPEVRHV